ncbi:MAG: hypothetical protein M0Z96_05360, partial [Actinomycetota bacterium]|nr:hypothetical protein [Actinomycetota bacterium]
STSWRDSHLSLKQLAVPPLALIFHPFMRGVRHQDRSMGDVCRIEGRAVAWVQRAIAGVNFGRDFACHFKNMPSSIRCFSC